MRNSLLLLVVMSILLAHHLSFAQTPAEASASADAMSLQQAISGPGSLVILKGETISGHNADGSAAYQQDVIYYGPNESLTPRSDYYLAAAGKLTCTAMVETVDADYNPGADIALKQGSSIAWDTDQQVDSFRDTNNIPFQGLRLTFFSSHSKLSTIYCTEKGNGALTPLTVQDFEDAMGGRMTLRPGNVNLSH